MNVKMLQHTGGLQFNSRYLQLFFPFYCMIKMCFSFNKNSMHLGKHLYIHNKICSESFFLLSNSTYKGKCLLTHDLTWNVKYEEVSALFFFCRLVSPKEESFSCYEMWSVRMGLIRVATSITRNINLIALAHFISFLVQFICQLNFCN